MIKEGGTITTSEQSREPQEVRNKARKRTGTESVRIELIERTMQVLKESKGAMVRGAYELFHWTRAGSTECDDDERCLCRV